MNHTSLALTYVIGTLLLAAILWGMFREPRV